jgi:adenosylcobinamide kinase/adenosylcobinamide-phosphate guanylyltransferase
MAKIILVTGASRSGKSDHAKMIAESLAGPRLFVATCPVLDEEMAERIRRHQRERQASLWDTIEEPVQVASAVSASLKYKVILVDCLTLWINNVLCEAEAQGRTVTEDDIIAQSSELLEACFTFGGTIILVTNEIGWGIVPENRLARLYRDLVGRCNRCIAEKAHEVILVTCGIPMVLKSVDGNELKATPCAQS